MAEQTFPQFATDALHAGQEPEQWNSRAVIPIISLATTFKQYEPGVPFSVSFTVFLMLENTCIYILSKKIEIFIRYCTLSTITFAKLEYLLHFELQLRLSQYNEEKLKKNCFSSVFCFHLRVIHYYS